MNPSRLYAANIRNLTDLWKAMGSRATRLDKGLRLQASESWPDRLWLEPQEPQRPLEPQDVARLLAAARAAGRSVTLPAWSEDDAARPDQARPARGIDLGRELGAAGLEVQFEQTLMALDLEDWRADGQGAGDLELERVVGDAADWAAIASRSFGYTVAVEVAERIARDEAVSLLTARREGQLVGTGLVFADRGVAGLHMVGVLPEARRTGIARKIMIHLLDDARARGLGHATLQASRMGAALYRELGFQPQGQISNFLFPARSRP